MQILILGGTGWLGRETARQAVSRGHQVSCLARGDSGPTAEGARLVRADRSRPQAYDEVRGQEWDAVIEVSWQPGFVRGALDALAGAARHWGYVSSCSVYADTDVPDADESAPTLAPLQAPVATREDYGSAKVACELACLDAIGDRLLIARSGLIGGPGDPSDRGGYWVARSARAPHEPMLVPAASQAPSQILDVRDLAAWLLDCAEQAAAATANVVGPTSTFEKWVGMSREIGGHQGEVVRVPGRWLTEHGVEVYMGPQSLAMWLAEPEQYGFASRNAALAGQLGLVHRPTEQLLVDVLEYERSLGLDRDRQAGLSDDRERELIEAYRAGTPG